MRILPLLLLTSALAACSNVPLNRAPVVNRSFAPQAAASAPAAPTVFGPFAAFAGQPGYYTVQPGDTLRRIALQKGQDWRKLVRWNNLTDPDVIEVGEVLRIAPPPPGAAASASEAGPGVQAFALGASARPAASAPAAAASRPVAKAALKPARAKAASAAGSGARPAPPVASAASGAASRPLQASDLKWAWPAPGKVLQGFDGAASKGLDIAGNAGDPVLAAAPGKVVYAGNELRGFGNLVIVKHNADYISVYAHNDKLLVKDGQDVKRGQQIALMGSSDAPRVELHFEVRLRGKPIDPMQVLPAR